MTTKKKQTKEPETKTPDESQVMIFVPRHRTLADRESDLLSFAVGICWGLIVAQIMRICYGKEKSKKENQEAKIE